MTDKQRVEQDNQRLLEKRISKETIAGVDKHIQRMDAMIAKSQKPAARANGKAHHPPPPEIIGMPALAQLDVPAPEMLIEGMLPARGAVLCNGAEKSGKTILAIQAAIAIASGRALFDWYRVLKPGPGPTMVIEQDDLGATASVKDIVMRCGIPPENLPMHLVPKVPWTFGQTLFDWLRYQIAELGLKLVVLDSYSALRNVRSGNCDIVKMEQSDMSELDCIGKQTGCLLLVLHHVSGGRRNNDWSAQAAGTYAMTAATESQIHISRFAELDDKAPERLVRIRGRHHEDMAMVLKFRQETLDYEHVLEGCAASMYPLLGQLRTAFGEEPFAPKDVIFATGVSRATAHRLIDRLYRASVLRKDGYGKYVLSKE